MVGTFRKKHVVFFFIGMLITAARAGNDEEFFLRGNKQYEHKDYDSAFRFYDLIHKKGRAVFYNMGNCCFYKGDYAQALVYWSRAEAGANRQERLIIARNKEQVLKLLGQHEHASSWWHAVGTLLEGAVPIVPLIILQLLFLLCWYLFIFFSRKQQLKSKKMMLCCLSFFIVISGLILEIHYTRQGIQNGIVIKKEGKLFVGPDKGLQALCPVAYANNVTIKQAREGWYKVQYADMIGWVEADVVQII